MPIKTVAIIGAGLSGLSLALFLHKHNSTTNIKIYELRSSTTTSEGALMLSPNALRTLDTLGVYARIKDRGFHFRDLSFNNAEHETLDTYEMGNEAKFGYDALRVYRQVLLDELKGMVGEVGVEVVYGRKFERVVSEEDGEGDGGVRFAFEDGGEETVDLLVGADGIHSSVRKVLDPDVRPAFSNFLAVTYPVQTMDVEFPFKPYPLPVGIHSSAGAFVLAPQNPEGSEMLAGIQYRTHERDREGWDGLWRNKDGLYRMIRESYDSWNPMVQSALDAVPKEKLSIWPFYTVPKISRWSSGAGRVVILGDSAHAIPPAAGQGVNQAFEDVHSLALLVAATNEGTVGWKPALEWWQQYRQARIDRVNGLTDEMNKRRMPGWSGEGAENIDSSWLFGVDVDGDVREWVERRV